MDVGDDWKSSSREVPLSSPRISPLPHPHFNYGLEVDRDLTFVHLETEEKGQEEGELRRGEKRSSSCGEMMRSGTGKAEKSEATSSTAQSKKEREREREKEAKQVRKTALLPFPRASQFPPLSVPYRVAMASLRMMSGSMTSTRSCGGPAAAARVSFLSRNQRGVENPSTKRTAATTGDNSISTRLGVADVERGSVHQPRERMSRRDCACLTLSERSTVANQRRRAAPHHRRCSALFPLFDVAAHFSILSLSLYYNNSLHAQPSRGALVISASQFVSSWSLFGGNK